MYISGKIKPEWKIEDFTNLPYKLDHDKEVVESYGRVGHSSTMMNLYNCFEYNLTFDRLPIVTQFNFLKNITLAVNLLTPGQYVPLHIDRYETYKRLFDITPDQTIVRIIIMIQDHSPGQMLQILDNTIGVWNAGDWFGWHENDLHGTYNFSKINRYAIQLTGTA